MATTFKKLISLMAYDATLTEDPNDFYLRAKTMPQSIDLRALADEVAQRLGRNADDVFTVLNAAETVKTDAVASGYIVSTPTALIRPSASGTVQKADLSQPVDRTRVRVYATLGMGAALRQAMQQCQVEIFTQPAVVGPLLNGAAAQTRAADGSVATRAPQPGKNIRLTGRNLKLVGDDPTVGVTFTSVESPQTTVFVPLEDVTVNEPRQLIFVLPTAVTDGLWRVTVTTQSVSNGNGIVKEPRSYTLDEPIEVGEVEEGGGGNEGGGTGSMG